MGAFVYQQEDRLVIVQGRVVMSTSTRLSWSLGLVLALGLLVMPTLSEAQDYGGFRGRVTDATGDRR